MVERPKVFVAQGIPEAPLTMLREFADVEIFTALDRRCTRAELLEAIPCVDYLFGLGEAIIDAEAINAGSRLKMIGVMEIFPSSIDIATATLRGIPVAGLPQSSEITETTAEYTWALINALSWRIPMADRFLRAGQWKQYQSMSLPTDRLRGRTLGIVGLGAIGRGVARRALAGGMRILYNDRAPLPAAEESALNVFWRELDDLFGEADIVLVSTVLTQETEGLISADVLAHLRKDSLFVNTSRGRVIDESALADALEEGRLAGAALDVFEKELPYFEPGPNPRLLELPNVILTPHIGTSARQTRSWMAQQVVSNIRRHLDGKRPRNVLNPEVYGEPPLPGARIG